MKDVVTIGDALITFEPSSNGPLRYAHSFERKAGGAELNFAIGCSRLGLNTGWIGRLGNDEFGRYLLNFVRGEGIDVSEVKLVDGYPTSLNFKEMMEDGSGSTFYYRANSPTLTLTPEDIKESYFEGVKLLHISGVFPSIAPKNVDILRSAIEAAKKRNVMVSLDPNIRLKMWTKERAKEVLSDFLPYTDILLTGVEEAKLLLGTSEPKEIIEKSVQLGIAYVAVKQGAEGSVGYFKGQTINAPPVPPRKVVDTVGAGDGYDAGFIYGVLQGWPLAKILNFANTIGSMVVSVSGDNEGLPYLDDVLVQLGEKQFIER